MAIPIISRGQVHPGEETHFLKVHCPPFFGSNANPDPQPPTRTFQRNIMVSINHPIEAEIAARTRAQQASLPLWIIENQSVTAEDLRVDPRGTNALGGELSVGDAQRVFPSSTVRTVARDVCHAFVTFSSNSHTIHWHGIEPTTMNDGVGHTSFESTNQFPYQFATNSPGTFFYHCHKNAPLHVEMGMYGFLIVDPPAPPGDVLVPPYSFGGPGWVAANLDAFPQFQGPNYVPSSQLARYDAEALWAVDEFDSTWHLLNHQAFMQQCDVVAPMAPETFLRGILNDFRPDVFLITGLNSVPTTPIGQRPEQGAPILAPPVVVQVPAGQNGLIRILNAGYTTQEYVLGVDALVISADGRPFGADRWNPRRKYSKPFFVRAGTPFRVTAARRFEVLVRAPNTPGATFPAEVRFYDWMRGPQSPTPVLFHIARTEIQVI
jgi:FtsP/CotA-like multicopper oxidase with cupredoxin domain